jgi:predicted helicase
LNAGSPNSGESKSQLQINNENGAAFEQEFADNLTSSHTDIAEQVTIKTDSGVNTRIDFVAKNENGDVVCFECKSSETAPLSKNQKKAFPEIEQTGGTVAGKGKPGYEGGTRIGPTKVNIVRKKNTEKEYEHHCKQAKKC